MHDDFPWNVPTSTSAAAEAAVVTRPDFWTSLLFKRIVGDGVLPTKTTGAGGNVPKLLSYCHCSRRFKQGLAFLFVNTANVATNVDFKFAGVAAGARWNAIRYDLSPGAHTSAAEPSIALNGKMLAIYKTDSGWELPSLAGIDLTNSPEAPTKSLVVAAKRYLFLELPSAAIAVCV